MSKSFMGNPALQFITRPQTEDTPDEKIRESEKPVSDGTDSNVTTKAPKKHTAAKKTVRRKSDKVEYKVDPTMVEKRTRRLQLVLQPSLYRKVADKAKKQNISVNDYIHKLLEEDTREEL